jgi:NAD(P)-dependent dehydrogenase (short-subunit alcohol dehydrogenase family)
VEIAGKSALVAGGASGLGEATARVLVEAGAAVTIADLNAEKGEALAAELGPSATFVQADVTDGDAVSAAVERAATHDDGLRISVCCAGIGWAERVAHKRGPHNLEFFSNVVKVNLIGTSKGGIVGMTLPAARDMASRGVRVVTIAPGLFDTPLLAALPEDARTALGAGIPFPSRLGRPEEYGRLVTQIVANPMLNGETIRLDGALRMPPR